MIFEDIPAVQRLFDIVDVIQYHFEAQTTTDLLKSGSVDYIIHGANEFFRFAFHFTVPPSTWQIKFQFFLSNETIVTYIDKPSKTVYTHTTPMISYHVDPRVAYIENALMHMGFETLPLRTAWSLV